MKRRARAALIALALTASGALALAAGAAAGPSRYVYETCDSVLPAGGTSGVFAAPHPRIAFGLENSCAQPGGALVVRQPAIGPGDGGDAGWGVPIATPPGTSAESITISALFCAGGLAAAGVLAEGWPPPRCAEEARSFALGSGFKGFSVKLGCVDPGAGGGCPAGPAVAAHYFATTVVDPAPPAITGVGGSLLEGGVRRGHQSVSLAASDEGGGLSSLTVSVNGLPAAQPKAPPCNVAQAANPSVRGTVAAQPAPCPPQASASWILDTGSYPFRDGPNTVMLCASDFATLGDPNSACAAPRTVGVDSSCAESGVGGGQLLSAQFARSNAEQVTVGYAKGAKIVGRLVDDAGDPVPGAALCVRAQTLGLGGRAEPIGSARTDAEGRYSYALSPGPNREVTIGYRHESAQVVRAVRFYAHARPRLRASAKRVDNGRRVRFAGALPGPGAGGRVVVLQAGTVGSPRWITFRRATADAKGRFSAAYRFSSTTRPTRYRFRALVPRQAGYPWVEGHSKPAVVLVGPGSG